MELLIAEDQVKHLAFYGLNTRVISIYKNSVKKGELYIQNPDLFATNMYSLLTRLKNNEIDEINYRPSRDESIVIKRDGNEIMAFYHTENERMLIKLKKFLEKFKK